MKRSHSGKNKRNIQSIERAGKRRATRRDERENDDRPRVTVLAEARCGTIGFNWALLLLSSLLNSSKFCDSSIKKTSFFHCVHFFSFLSSRATWPQHCCSFQKEKKNSFCRKFFQKRLFQLSLKCAIWVNNNNFFFLMFIKNRIWS